MDELNRNEATLSETIPENDQVTLELETEYGKSEQADYVRARCEDIENCPGKLNIVILTLKS